VDRRLQVFQVDFSGEQIVGDVEHLIGLVIPQVHHQQMDRPAETDSHTLAERTRCGPGGSGLPVRSLIGFSSGKACGGSWLWSCQPSALSDPGAAAFGQVSTASRVRQPSDCCVRDPPPRRGVRRSSPQEAWDLGPRSEYFMQLRWRGMRRDGRSERRVGHTEGRHHGTDDGAELIAACQMGCPRPRMSIVLHTVHFTVLTICRHRAFSSACEGDLRLERSLPRVGVETPCLAVSGL